MDFSQVAVEFRKLKAQYDAGALSEADFKARLQDLMLQDEQGRWWMIGYETGQWYVHDGEKWVRGEPPVPPGQPTATTAPPEMPAITRTEPEGFAPRPRAQPSRPWLRIGAGIVAAVVVIAVIAQLAGHPQPTPTPMPPTATPVPPTGTSAPPTATPRPTLGVGSIQISDKDSMILVYVPPGEFLMGSADADSEADSDEKPQHKVTLDAYWIDRTEVTNAQYRKCVAAGACQPPSDSKSATRAGYYSGAEYDNYPVILVSWDAAQKYCRWAGRRLPTEAEWEKAARGTDGRKYPWGAAAPDAQRANFTGDKGDITAVGSYPSGASLYGALDMAGNVLEWVADWYNETYYRNAPEQNPKGPDAGQYHGLRGGSWYDLQWGVRAAFRGRHDPDLVPLYVGFRCARS